MREGAKKRAFVYTGLSLADDLRAWLSRLADQLQHELDAHCERHPRASSAELTWNVGVPRNRLRDAIDVVRHVSRVDEKTLARVLPDHLPHNRRRSGERFWMAVDAALAGPQQLDKVAKRWGRRTNTVQRALRDLRPDVEQYVASWDKSALQTEVAELRKIFRRQRN